jgi:hypothetical protein
MTESIPTSEVLNRAADLIEERGWAQGTIGWNLPNSGLCLEGAILAVMGGSGADDQIKAWTCPAYAAVGEYLAHPPLSSLGDRELWRWNDTVANGATHVIEVLRACAVIVASRERETAEVSA